MKKQAVGNTYKHKFIHKWMGMGLARDSVRRAKMLGLRNGLRAGAGETSLGHRSPGHWDDGGNGCKQTHTVP